MKGWATITTEWVEKLEIERKLRKLEEYERKEKEAKRKAEIKAVVKAELAEIKTELLQELLQELRARKETGAVK